MPRDSEMTAEQAADVLTVSARQIRRLADAGELVVVGRVGRSLLLDADSVHRLARRGRGPGRPWDERTAWAAIDLLGNGRTVALPTSQRSRLRSKLTAMDAEQFVRNARRRAVVTRYRGQPSMLGSLRADMALTGSSAIISDREVAARFGLASGELSTLDGYVDARAAEAVKAKGYLVGDTEGNVTLRVTSATRRWGATAEDVVIAVDLAESLDPRSRSAGISYLRSRLDSL